MKNFLLNRSFDLKIELFSIYHFFLIILVFLVCCLIINNKERFSNLQDYQKKILRFVLACILIINLILRRGSYIYYGLYDWRFHLDINFCNFTSILFLFYCFTGNKKIYNICYYMTFIGPLTAIIIPSVNISPLNYSFYSFILLHHVIFIFNFIFMYIEKKEFGKKDFKSFVVFLLIYFSIIYIFNFIFGTTYNTPLTFINNNIRNTYFIRCILDITGIEYFSMFIVVCFFINVAIYILKKIQF